MSGLVGIASADLDQLLADVRSGRLACPIGSANLSAVSLTHLAPRLAGLQELGAASVVAVLEAVLAERRRANRPEVQLVWTGPEAVVSEARDTAVVLRELFAGAQESVLVAGFRFDHGGEILEPLHRAMRDRGVRVRMFLNVTPGDGPAVGAEDCAREAAARFLDTNWRFGEPVPQLLYDPRTTEPGKHISLHAKCVVVDARRSLVSSANFTRHGQERNIEVGVLVDDPEFAARLLGQWQGAIAAGILLPCPSAGRGS